jgi:hypothetical protein
LVPLAIGQNHTRLRNCRFDFLEAKSNPPPYFFSLRYSFATFAVEAFLDAWIKRKAFNREERKEHPQRSQRKAA